MKTKKFKTITWVFIALLMGTTTVFAQPGRNIDRTGFGYGYGGGYCLNVLTDLTEEQQEQITKLEASHQEAMVELRIEQRSAVDPIEKNEIRGEMLKRVKAHRDEVRSLLTEEQKKQYDLLQARRNYGGKGFARGYRGRRGQAAFGSRRGRGQMGNCRYYGGGRGYRGRW